MGWTYYYATEYRNGKIDRLAECRKEFGRNPEWAASVKDAMVGSIYYAAMKLTKTGEVFGLIVLTAVDKNEFGYKDMDETMHPYNYDCPVGILNLLTPTNNEMALEWRAGCYVKIVKRKLLVKAKKIQLTLPEYYNGKYYKPKDVVNLTRYSKSVWSDTDRRIGFKQSDVLRYKFTIIE